MSISVSGRTAHGVADTPKKPMSRAAKWSWLVYLVLILLALIYIYPFLIQLGTSFKTDADATANATNPFPNPFSSDAFSKLSSADFPRWFTNSVIVTVFVTLGRVFLDSLAGYALARLHFAGRSVVSGALIAIMAVPGVVLLIPKYLVLVQLHMYNTYWALIIPLLADAAGVFIMRQFFVSIPLEVEESARIDGASVFRTFWSVVLPMARPAVITLVVLSFQASWNELTHFIVASNDPKLTTLTKGLAQIASGAGLGSGNQYPFKMAGALLATIPVAILFFVFQRFFVQGANSGAVKG